MGLFCVPNITLDSGEYKVMTESVSSIVAGTIAATGPLLLAGTDPTVAVALMSTL